MTIEVIRPLRIFYIYAHQDKAFLEEIEKHLRLLVRKGQIITWHNRNIAPGAEWADNIDIQLETADIVLLLVSPDFFSSSHCELEMEKALARREAKKVHVIPILLRPIDYITEPKISKLQMLPSGAKAISLWGDKVDEAFFDVGKSIRTLVETMLKQQTKINAIANKDILEEDLTLCEEELRQDPGNSSLHKRRGDILFNQRHFAEALSAYHRAIELNPDYSAGYLGKARIYEQLAQQNHEQARVYEQLARQSYMRARRPSIEDIQGENK